MKNKKSKAVVLELSCPCGYSWTAAYPNGNLKKVCRCRGCGNFIKTDGSSKPANRPKECPGCRRPLINGHHCTYCGRPVNETEASKQITKELEVQFCTDDNLPKQKA